MNSQKTVLNQHQGWRSLQFKPSLFSLFPINSWALILFSSCFCVGLIQFNHIPKVFENIKHRSTLLFVHRVHGECYSSFRKAKAWWFIWPSSTCFLILLCQGPRGMWWISVRRLMKWLEMSAGLWYPFGGLESPWTSALRKGFRERFHHLRLKLLFMLHDETSGAPQQTESAPFSAQWIVEFMSIFMYFLCVSTPKQSK